MRLVFWLPVFFVFSSCHKDHMLDCFKSNGSESTEIRYPGPFKYIEVHDKMDVNIYQGNEYKVEINAGKNIVKNISCTIKDNLLTIHNTSVCNFVRGYKRRISIKVTMPFVAKIYNYGVGNIVLDPGFDQDSALFVRSENSGDTYINGKFNEVSTGSHGNGDMYLTGSSKILLLYSFGTNFVYAGKFKVSDQVYISTYSIGNAYLNLQGVSRFEYYIWGPGNIYYTGDPQSINNLGIGKANGKGQVIKQD